MIRHYNDILSQTNTSPPSESACSKEELPEEFQSLASYLNSCGFPCYQNTQAQYFPLGDDAFEVMCDELQKRPSTSSSSSISSSGRATCGAASLKFSRKRSTRASRCACCTTAPARSRCCPIPTPKARKSSALPARCSRRCARFVSTHYNYRDHRKIMVIDGKIGFTGGINLSDEYINRTSRLGHWKDTAIALRGDAVRSLTLMFLQMWDVSSVHFTPEVYSKYLDVPQPVREKGSGLCHPHGDSPLDRDLVGEMVYMDIINRANRYVHIMTPYLIIDNEMVTALTYAARRGVEVQLILPHVPDKEIAFSLAHTYYRRLLENGVQIYEYEPGFVHAKVFVSDDCKATVGTINLDYRSLYHHFECGTYLYASPEVAKIEQDFQQTLAKMRPRGHGPSQKRPVYAKAHRPRHAHHRPTTAVKKVETVRFRLFLSRSLFKLLERAAHGSVLLLHRHIEWLYAFRASNPDRAQRFRHLRAGVGASEPRPRFSATPLSVFTARNAVVVSPVFIAFVRFCMLSSPGNILRKRTMRSSF